MDGDYFRTLGLTLLQGRAFRSSDGPSDAPVAVVSQTAARFLWPGQDPIGKRFRLGEGEDPWITTVGLVSDLRQQDLSQDPQPIYNRPPQQVSWPDGLFRVVRSPLPPEVLVPSLRELVAAADPELPLTDVAAVTRMVERSVSAPRFRAVLLCEFGGMALLLSLLGIYGVVAYSAAQRVGEIGLRIALGADRGTFLPYGAGPGPAADGDRDPAGDGWGRSPDVIPAEHAFRDHGTRSGHLLGGRSAAGRDRRLGLLPASPPGLSRRPAAIAALPGIGWGRTAPPRILFAGTRVHFLG